jgi:hypothetical protein
VDIVKNKVMKAWQPKVTAATMVMLTVVSVVTGRKNSCLLDSSIFITTFLVAFFAKKPQPKLG